MKIIQDYFLRTESQKNFKFSKFQNTCICCYKMGSMVILHQFLSPGHKMSSVATQESNV